MRRFIVVVLLLIAAVGWSQQYANQNDGRNWVSWSFDTRSAVVLGMMMGEHAWLDLIRAGYQYGNGDVAYNFLQSAEGLQGGAGYSVRTIREAMDSFYSDYAKRTVPIWKAYFLSRGIAIWTDAE